MLKATLSILLIFLVSSLMFVSATDDEYIARQKSLVARQNALMADLTKDYNKNTLPGYEPFPVNISVKLPSVGDFDEINEKLSTVVSIVYYWYDYSFKWDPREWNVSYITLGWSDVWKPVLRVKNAHAEDKNQYADMTKDTIVYYWDGYAYYRELLTTRTTCDLDMTFYPFDIQKCHIWMYITGSEKLDFLLSPTLFQGDSETSSGAWKLIWKNITSNKGRDAFDLELHFERKPLFLLLNVFLPLIVLALLSPIVFLLPHNSGERVGFSLTLLLAVSVYMTIVSDNLPQNSDPTPIVSVVIFVWYVTDSITVFVVVFNIKLYAKQDKAVSYVPRKFVIFTRMLSNTCNRKEDAKPQAPNNVNDGYEEEAVTDNAELSEVIVHGLSKKQDQTSADDKFKYQVTWENVSCSIDKWCVGISYVIKLGIPFIFTVTKVGQKQA